MIHRKQRLEPHESTRTHYLVTPSSPQALEHVETRFCGRKSTEPHPGREQWLYVSSPVFPLCGYTTLPCTHISVDILLPGFKLHMAQQQ